MKKRKEGYYWTFGNKCFEIKTWSIYYWDGNCFWNGNEDFSEDSFERIDEREIKREYKYKIGDIVKPKKIDWLTEDKIQEYLKQQGWGNLKNSVIDGFIWTQYLNEHDYEKVYLSDAENSKEEIIEQILKKLSKLKY
jgi:hypothetical protein